MTEDIIKPIADSNRKSANLSKPIGRQADRLAALLAGLAAALSIIAAIWFFIGFAENDKRPEHLTSAFILTLILFAFAVIPFSLVTVFARKAFMHGTKRLHLFWVLFLMLPWVILGTLAVSHTPLPFWSGLIMVILAGLISIWALASLILDRKLES